MKRFAIRAAWIMAATSALLAVGYAGLLWARHWYFPYGWSHCCLKQVGLALHVYAEANNGWYPAGGDCPEASLSMLHKHYGMDADTLRGKTVPLADVEARLNAGLPLTPETCGWHYVEGLKSTDDPQLAVVWDKIGLGHNGERLSGGGHSVLDVTGSERRVSEAEWPEFIADQKARLAALAEWRREQAARKAKSDEEGFRLLDYLWPFPSRQSWRQHSHHAAA